MSPTSYQTALSRFVNMASSTRTFTGREVNASARAVTASVRHGISVAQILLIYLQTARNIQLPSPTSNSPLTERQRVVS